MNLEGVKGFIKKAGNKLTPEAPYRVYFAPRSAIVGELGHEMKRGRQPCLSAEEISERIKIRGEDFFNPDDFQTLSPDKVVFYAKDLLNNSSRPDMPPILSISEDNVICATEEALKPYNPQEYVIPSALQ